jgi:hypothetical protein
MAFDVETPTKVGAKALREITLKALEGSPAWLKGFIFIPALAGLITFILGVVLAVRGQDAYAFGLVLAALVFFGVESFLVYRTVSRVLMQAQEQPIRPIGSHAVWSRVVPKWPLPSDKVDELAAELENIRNHAFLWLQSSQCAQALQANEVRANVFLPDYTKPSPGDACTLVMPDRLRVGMDGDPDEHISFRPLQGLTGLVFARKGRKFAKTFETSEGAHEFEDYYQLTEKQKQMIHPGLRWIVSFPLSVPGDRMSNAMGVLNVDGLNHQLSNNDLKLLWGELSTRVADFAGQLAHTPKVRITISLEEETHA